MLGNFKDCLGWANVLVAFPAVSTKKATHRRGAENAEKERWKKTLCELCGHEKKSKNNKIRKNGMNKIDHLRVPIPAKIDFFSRPVSLR